MRTLMLPNSTTAHESELWNKVCKSNGFATPEQCQPSLWSYNGAVAAGHMAVAPILPFGPISEIIGIPQSFVEKHTQFPKEGLPQTTKAGRVDSMRVLYACGTGDTSNMCTDRLKTDTAALVSNFTYLRLSCGHDLEVGGKFPQDLVDAILDNIEPNRSAWP
jgi:hypothetical protein